jgi:hypothetical protein
VKLGGATEPAAATARSGDRRNASLFKTWFGMERRVGNVT